MQLTGPPFPSLPHHRVQPARLPDGTEVVLKQGPDLEREARILELGHPALVRLIARRPDELVLERLGPPLADLQDDEEATRLAAALMARLRLPPLPGYPTLHDRARGFRDQPRAEGLYRELLASQAEPVLLHGDLHHHNILQAHPGWAAIDPQGVVGEPAYETGALLRNPLLRVLKLPGKKLSRRLDLLSEMLGHERERLRGWAWTQAVLAACWSRQDEDGDEQAWMTIAERLAQA